VSDLFILNSLKRELKKIPDKYALTREWERLDSSMFVFFPVFVHEVDGRKMEIYNNLIALQTSHQCKINTIFLLLERWCGDTYYIRMYTRLVERSILEWNKFLISSQRNDSKLVIISFPIRSFDSSNIFRFFITTHQKVLMFNVCILNVVFVCKVLN